MSYQVFARKYRPKTFDDVLGQDHVVRTLKNAISQNRLAHAYLFVGPRGTGKTSTARIFAKALNAPGGPRIDFDPNHPVCVEIAEGRSLDVLEIDGASNNSVDDVRNIRETVRFAPSSGQFKIFYIDEVHMLSTAAFNALLKTLEEPPEHVKFIFATTEAHKVLPTILSRCQRFDLRPIPAETIAQHLLHIASAEGVQLDETAAWAVAKGADGGMRDAQSMLDQLVAFCGNHITEANVLDVFGFTSRETVAAVTHALLTRNTPATLSLIQREAEAGRELSQLLGEIISCLRALLVARIDGNSDGEGIPATQWQSLVESASSYPVDRLLAVIDGFAETEGRMKWASNKRLHLELGFIKAIQTIGEVRLSDVIKVLAGASDQLVMPAPDTSFPTIEASPPPASLAPAPTLPASTASSPQPLPPEPTSEPTPTPEAPPPTPETLPPPQPQQEPAPEPAPTPEPEIPASSQPQPAPLFETEPSTAPAPPEPEPIPEPPPESSAPRSEGILSLDELIAIAPDEPEPQPEPEPVSTPPWQPEPSAEPAPPKADPMEEFYQDPLIQKALEMFEATLKR